MGLVKISVLNGVATVIKLLSALLLNKILAVYVGPNGYAVIGQFQNVVSIVSNLAGGLLATGVTKYTAQHYDDIHRQERIWQTAFRLSLLISVPIGVCLLLARDPLSQWLLHQTTNASVFAFLAVALPAMAANNLLLAIVNGKKDIHTYVIANIVGSFISLAVIGGLSFFFQLYGALLAITIAPAVALFSTAALVARRPWCNLRSTWGPIDKPSVRALTGFAMMGLTSALVVPLSYILIRDQLSSALGLQAAGYWQAMWKISEIYLLLITTTLATYYLPRLSEISAPLELKAEILKVYKFAMPLVLLGAVGIYVLRDFIILTLFTADFAPMQALFGWQLCGDVVKIGSWVLGYILVGRAMVTPFIITEVLFAALFVLLTRYALDIYGLTGVSIAYAATYTLHWFTMFFLVRREMASMSKPGPT